MRIGVPKEIKPDEYRVGLIPAVVGELTARGHQVLIETQAGAGAGLADGEYASAGARIVPGAEEVYAQAELVVKVKEPLAVERVLLRRGQTIFTYLHLAADPEQARGLMVSGVAAIAYETVTDEARKLPLLAPMSKVAGRMAVQVAAHFLERPQGGRGLLFGGIADAPPAQVVILGGGIVGANAADVALAMGADVTVTARNAGTLRQIIEQFGGKARTVTSTPEATATLCEAADVVIGAALVAGAATPKLVSAATVRHMKPGAVIVDVAIDQGGCVETSRPTTHSDPVFTIGGVVHYCVTNMPGAVPRTSAFALSHATAPFVLALADKGVAEALATDPHLRAGLNVHDGHITCRAVADALALPYVPAEEALKT